MARVPQSVSVGIVAGLLFFAHGMINNSHAWPLIWPLLGGAAAAVARRRQRLGFGPALERGAVAGVTAGALFLGLTAASLTILSQRGVSEIVGMEADAFNAATVIALTIVSGIGIIAALIGSLVAMPLMRKTA